jgi:DNA helicase-2/ATP-dependent DNA helicase PcrA
MTLHAAKGLEFPCVYIVGLEDGLLPHERSSNDDDQLEEERRLLFVGITRAEEELQLSRCQNRFRRGSFWPCIASRFLMELPREQMQIYEPSSYRGSHNDLVNSLDGDSWGDGGSYEDLPSIDINAAPSDDADTDTDFTSGPSISYEADAGSELPDDAGPSQAKEALAKFPIPQLLTGAELAATQAALTGEKLQPDDFSLDMEVQHAEYGIGTVVKLSGDGKKRIATIDFPDLGEKRIRLAFSNFRAV